MSSPRSCADKWGALYHLSRDRVIFVEVRFFKDVEDAFSLFFFLDPLTTPSVSIFDRQS